MVQPINNQFVITFTFFKTGRKGMSPDHFAKALVSVYFYRWNRLFLFIGNEYLVYLLRYGKED